MSQQHNAADAFLTGGGIPSAFSKDDPIGTTVTGVVCDPAPAVKQQTDIRDGHPLTWDNGDPKMQLVVTIQTDKRDPAIAEDDGRRALYVKGSTRAGSRSLHDAVSSAVRAVNARGLAVGGRLTVQLVGTEPSATRGFSDRKLWAASYAAPDPTTVSGAFLGAQAAPAAYQQPATYAPAPAAYPQPQAAPTAYVPAPAPQPAPLPTAPPAGAVATPQGIPGMTPEQFAAYQAWQASQPQAQPA